MVADAGARAKKALEGIAESSQIVKHNPKGTQSPSKAILQNGGGEKCMKTEDKKTLKKKSQKKSQEQEMKEKGGF